MQTSSSPRFIRLALFFNGFEHFLTSLKLIYTPLIPLLFFTQEDYLTGIGFLFQIYPLGILAKPLGSLFFQYIEKKRDLSFLLKISYIGTGSASLMLGVISFFFPCVLKEALILGRFFQSFFSASEISGVTKVILDRVDSDGKKGINSWISTSSMLGIWFAFCFVGFFDLIGLLKISFSITHAFGFLLILGSFTLPHLSNPEKTRLRTPFFQNLKKALPIIIFAGFSAFCYSASFLAIPCCSFHKNTLLSQTFLISIDVLLIWGFGKTLLRWKQSDLLKGALAIGGFFPLLWLWFAPPFTDPFFLQLFLILVGCMFSAPLYPYLYHKSRGENQFALLSWSILIGSQIFGSLTPFAVYQMQLFIPLETALLTLTCFLSLTTLLFLTKEKEEKGLALENIS
ncbi:hypothetical protein EB008_00770 [bacterium]|nr:hypothetical protein [bacterium]